MSANFGIKAGAPSHIGLKAVARPREGLTVQDLLERMLDSGQHVEDVVADGIVLADMVYVNGNYLDHSEAADHELVWACEFCNAYSRTKAVTVAHEAECVLNPDNSKDN